MPAQYRRLIGAILVVLGLIAVPVFAGRAFAGAASAESFVSQIWDAVLAGKDFDAAVADIGFQKIDCGYNEWLDEICDSSLLLGAVANEDFSLICISKAGSAEDLEEVLRKGLLARGWNECSSGYGGVSTYIKERGECRWLMTECAEAAGEASAVLHIRRG